MSQIALTAIGLALAGVALVVITSGRRARKPLRVDPWPGLTGAGATLLLAHALLLAGTQLALGPADAEVGARSALPYLPLAATGATLTLILAARTYQMPGAATAVCGTYLLGRSLVTLLVPTVAPPPLFLVGAMAFEFVLWLRPSDFAALWGVWPMRMGRPRVEPEQPGEPRAFTCGRAALGGAAFGLLLAAQEPPFELLLGGDPAAWSPLAVLLAAVTAAALSGAVAWGVTRAPSWCR
jgi:hypothetical protein